MNLVWVDVVSVCFGGWVIVVDGCIVLLVQDCSCIYGGVICVLLIIVMLDSFMVEVGDLIVVFVLVVLFVEGFYMLVVVGLVMFVDMKCIELLFYGLLIEVICEVKKFVCCIKSCVFF